MRSTAFTAITSPSPCVSRPALRSNRMEAAVRVGGDLRGLLTIVRPTPKRRERTARPSTVASNLRAPLLVVASSVSLQSSAALATTVFAVYGPVGTGALRFAVAAPILLAIVRPSTRSRSRSFWTTVAILAATLIALNFLLYEAIARAPLGTVVTLQFLGPLALALQGARRRLDILWATAAGVGVALLTGGPASGSTLGLVLAFAAAVVTTVSLATSRRLACESAGADGITIAVALAAIATLPISIRSLVATAASPGDLALLLAVATLGVTVPYSLEFLAIRRVSLRAFSILLSLDPAIAAIAGALFLAQTLSIPGAVGVGLVILASIGAIRGGRGHAPTPTARSSR